MLHKIQQLILFRPGEESILSRLSVLEGSGGAVSAVCVELRRLLDLAREWDFSGDLWQCYLSWLLAMDENPFSLACEGKERAEDALSALARRDLAIYRELFSFDLAALGEELGVESFEALCGLDAMQPTKHQGDAGALISGLAANLAAAESDDAFYSVLARHYAACGVGELGLYRAFKLDSAGALKPIESTDPARFSDLVGCETQTKELLDNTRAFLAGKGGNNVLLYGDSGTGKSTSIKALINECWADGLRLIEAYKYQLHFLPDVIAGVKKRGYHFILYIDDLSFEDFEAEYKFLKSVIEGDVEGKPKNLLVYATSNRRHLVKETWNDRGDMTHQDDIHHSDTLEEKLSLAGRFGLSINFSSPRRKEYHAIVAALARRAGVVMDEAELFRRADAWEIRHGGVSGRTAQQFINYLVCNAGADEKEPIC